MGCLDELLAGLDSVLASNFVQGKCRIHVPFLMLIKHREGLTDGKRRFTLDGAVKIVGTTTAIL